MDLALDEGVCYVASRRCSSSGGGTSAAAASVEGVSTCWGRLGAHAAAFVH